MIGDEVLTWIIVYNFIKFWLPLTTLIGLVIKGYFHATNRFYNWANAIIESNTKTIAERVDKAGTAVLEMASYHKAMVDSQSTVNTTINQLSDTFHDHKLDVLRNHTMLLAGIEIIKGKQDIILTHIDEVEENARLTRDNINEKVNKLLEDKNKEN